MLAFHQNTCYHREHTTVRQDAGLTGCLEVETPTHYTPLSIDSNRC